MCGISGIINKYNKKPTSQEIKTINDLISHRGPDDEGFYFGENFAFGHRRLSILDLSSDGHQPMPYMNKYTITYNGEIYNYIEIRDELLKDGYQFHSNTDTEVILAAYDKWGKNCVNKFNGMWAFALYDNEKNSIFCSRDRFGIKPFYYTEVNGKFVFGSEIKQLLEFYEDRFVNENILLDYLLYGLEEHTNETFFKGIYKLEQSHNLSYDLDAHSFKKEKYFHIEIDKKLKFLNEVTSIVYMQERLDEAIILRLRSDVKVGTCLSGGLDSSSIAAIVSKKYYQATGEQFVAIHAKSIEKKTDESEFAREVAKHCNCNLIEVEPTLEDISSFVDEVVYTQEEPFGGLSIFMQYFVMKKAKENNCTVMLDGQGGDETLFGYENYYSVYFASLFSKFKFIKLLQEFIQLKTFKISKIQVIKSTISTLLGNKMRYMKGLLGLNTLNLKVEYDVKRNSHLYDFMNFKDFQKRELMLMNLPHLLRYEDKNSMRHSVETRLPFIDYRFVEIALSINDSLKFKSGYLKYILRKIVDSKLPKNIVWRKNKFGFEAPTDTWITRYKEEMIAKINSSRLLKHLLDVDSIDKKNHTLVWKFYNIALWENIFDVKYERKNS